MIDFKSDDLNLLYAASLEFGENWRRPLIKWAQELFSKEDEKFQGTIAEYIGAVRTKIEDYISNQYEMKRNSISEKDITMKIRMWYPWMDQRNINHAFSQGMYYAWRG